MPRKTKETDIEKVVKKQEKLNEKIDTLIKNVLDSSDKPKKSTTKKGNKSTATKVAKSNVKTTESKAKKSKAEPTSKATKTTKATTKAKTAKAKSTTKTKTTAKSKKTTNSKKTTKSKITKAKSTVSKVKSTKVNSPAIVEYYDLPYKYNQTVAKILYQNPTTLFVYWEISDADIEYYKAQYGDNFFETTKPVLVIYNDTMNYHFEIDINDFANSWYFTINDSKCDYRVELARRPIFHNEKIKTDYICIASSNKIESPNDRILFSTNEPNTVYFRNTKNNNQRKVNLVQLLKHLNLSNKDFGFPIVRNIYDLYKNIYHIDDVGEFSISLTNPSSGNPSSHSLSSRFI